QPGHDLLVGAHRDVLAPRHGGVRRGDGGAGRVFRCEDESCSDDARAKRVRDRGGGDDRDAGAALAMSLLVLRVLERIHGHLGWLSVAALLHPAIFLRNPRRRARLAVALATAFTVTTGLLGGYVYPEYRNRLKQHIFIEAPRVGWLFERKEHLAV